jgi:UDP-N-acetylglucosamine:LPS N-acetylglucosamine transferase
MYQRIIGVIMIKPVDHSKHLVISSSGGGGHIAAANGKIQELTKKGIPQDNVTLIDVMGLHKVDGKVTNASWIPTIRLSGIEIFSGKQNTATWDETQKKGGMKAVQALESLVRWQPVAEFIQYRKVYNSMTACLEEAFKAGTPFTEILSTQAVSTPALLQAVVDYNTRHPDANLKIALTVTEFLSPRATHFLHSLSDLTPEQRAALKVEAVDFIGAPKEDLAAFKKKHHLEGIECDILGMDKAPVRQEFKDFKDEDKGRIVLKATGTEAGTVQASLPKEGIITQGNDISFEKGLSDHLITMTMGSQGTQTVLDYVDQFLADCKSGAYKPAYGDTKTYFCVLAGANKEGSLYQQLCKKLTALSPEDQALLANKNIHIVPLAFQDGKHMAALHCNSDVLITRSGGMSSIEAAYSQTKNPTRQTFIHTEAELTSEEVKLCKANADARYEKLRPGAVQWERGNGEYLMHKTGAAFCSTQVIDWGKPRLGNAAQPSLFKMAYDGKLTKENANIIERQLQKEGTNPNMTLPDGSHLMDHCDPKIAELFKVHGAVVTPKIHETVAPVSLFTQFKEAVKELFGISEKKIEEGLKEEPHYLKPGSAPRGYEMKGGELVRSNGHNKGKARQLRRASSGAEAIGPQDQSQSHVKSLERGPEQSRSTSI